ncbi:Zinc finger RING/FYVE/PHD-type protein [Dioscorea alata]|uniref:Zinc finger RING/FYVE/PHD-type protein n=1 Tax=Dioscorea alata TaxID=55571 RepID=A0ACB7W7L9_DIOAL|nr:Zinc finger RING/FYVE/PHD-type protein [Dioscorea alata]
MPRSEPFWQNNSSFSPPLSRRWDLRFRSEGRSLGSHGDSSNSKDSRNWLRGERGEFGHSHRYSPSDGVGSYIGSPSDSFLYHHLTPSSAIGVNLDDETREQASGPLSFSRLPEVTSGFSQSIGSTSSRSDGSEYENTLKAHVPSRRSFSSRYSFMSKPVHPVPFTDCTGEGDEATGSTPVTYSKSSPPSDLKSIQAFTELHSPGEFEFGGSSRRGTGQWSSASSIELADVSESLEAECSSLSYSNIYEGAKCCLCERFLSQRSPWGSRRLVRNGDMPVVSVLSCWHVFHAECLERTTSKTQKHDPPCPLCEKSEENVWEQWAACRLKNGVPRLKPLGEEGPSKVWTCGQVGDCVERALQTPKRANMLLLNRNRLKRQLSLKGSSGKDWAENSKKSGFYSSKVLDGRKLGDQVTVAHSRTAPCHHSSDKVTP